MNIEAGAHSGQSNVEADWQINDNCDMKCRYCFNTRNCAPVRPVTDPTRSLQFFDSTGKVWSLHLTGGEPFLSAGFVKLCDVLSSRHFISVNSNLSSPHVREFARKVDSSRVEYVHCCLHLEERDRLNGWNALEDNLRILRHQDFVVFASQVMTPETFAAFPAAARRLATLGVALIPKSLQGAFEGRWYPHAYSEREKVLFRELAEEAEIQLNTLTPLVMKRNVTVNPLHDREFLHGFPIFRGVACAAGKSFFTIRPNGNIYRCGSNQILGNIEKRDFHPLAASTPCNSTYYPYFCMRYSELLQKSPSTPILLQSCPSPHRQAIHSALRKGRQLLKRGLL